MFTVSLNAAQHKDHFQGFERLEEIVVFEHSQYVTPPGHYSPFTQKILHENGLNQDIADQKMLAMAEVAKKYDNYEVKIPPTGHRIWLSNQNCPVLIPQEILLRIHKMCEIFPSWSHFVWSNIDNILDKSFKCIEIDPPKNLFQRSIMEVSDNKAYFIASGLISKNAFAYSSDILRIMIINKFGGIYCDVGWIINPSIDRFRHFPYIIDTANWVPGIFSHTMIGSYPENPLLTAMLDRFNTNVFQTLRPYRGHDYRENTSPRAMTALVAIVLDSRTPVLLWDPEKYCIRFHSNSHVKGLYNSRIGIDEDAIESILGTSE